MTDDKLIYTLKEFSENAADVIKAIRESNRAAVITHQGRFLVIVRPIRDGIESDLVSGYLGSNPLPESGVTAASTGFEILDS